MFGSNTVIGVLAYIVKYLEYRNLGVSEAFEVFEYRCGEVAVRFEYWSIDASKQYVGRYIKLSKGFFVSVFR